MTPVSSVVMVLAPLSRSASWPGQIHSHCSPDKRVKTSFGACISPWGRLHTGVMSASLAIGDFSRATHLSVKTLRHYHRIGLLEPADVDSDSGHRRYAVEQIPTAQIIKRF